MFILRAFTNEGYVHVCGLEYIDIYNWLSKVTLIERGRILVQEAFHVQ